MNVPSDSIARETPGALFDRLRQSGARHLVTRQTDPTSRSRGVGGGDTRMDVDWGNGPTKEDVRENALATAARNVLDVAREHDVPLALAEALIGLREALDA